MTTDKDDEARALDDEQWLAILSGRREPSQGREAAEAAALRRAILNELDTGDGPDEVARARVQARVREATGDAGARRPKALRAVGFAAAAMLVVGVSAAILYQEFRPGPEAVVRGQTESGAVVHVRHPHRVGAQLRDRITAAGGQAWLTQIDGAWLLRAERPARVPDDLAARLDAHGITWDHEGRLEVRLRSTGPDK